MKIHFSVYFLIILGLYTNEITLIIFFLGSVFLHECGHILILKIYKQKIHKLELSIFGGQLMTTCKNNSFVFNFLLSISGVAVNLLICLCAYFLKIISNNSSNINTINNLILCNKILIIFNLLPIYPLDGFRIIEMIFLKFFSNCKKFKILNISLIALILLLIISIYNESLGLIIICLVLIFKNLDKIKNEEKFFLLSLVKSLT